jgi:hypothetical protein
MVIIILSIIAMVIIWKFINNIFLTLYFSFVLWALMNVGVLIYANTSGVPPIIPTTEDIVTYDLQKLNNEEYIETIFVMNQPDSMLSEYTEYTEKEVIQCQILYNEKNVKLLLPPGLTSRGLEDEEKPQLKIYTKEHGHLITTLFSWRTIEKYEINFSN